VDKREESIEVARPNSATKLGLTGCVTHSGINCRIELYGCSLTPEGEFRRLQRMREETVSPQI
jgi:hypothetical protein